MQKPKPVDKAEKKALADIEKYGLHVIHVLEDDSGPEFSYSVGLFESYGHPEIIIFGLRSELSLVLLNNMGHDIKSGKVFKAGEFDDGVLDGFLCYFGKVPKKQYIDYVGWDRWLYGSNDFPLVQCVYPTVDGIFPWEKDFPKETHWYCPMLTNAPKN